MNINRLPDELLLKIGEHLLAFPESSSLRAAALTSRRFCNVFSFARDQSLMKFGGVRKNFAKWLHSILDGEKNDFFRLLFWLKRRESEELALHFVHDTIDHITCSPCDDHKKSMVLKGILENLHGLVSVNNPELLPTVRRLVDCHNRLAMQVQGPTLVALAKLVRKLPAEVSENCIASLTHTMTTQGEKLSPELRQAVICELADLTDRVSDEKKHVHILNVESLIAGLPEYWHCYCHSLLQPYRRYRIVSPTGGEALKQWGRQLTNQPFSHLGSANEG